MPANLIINGSTVINPSLDIFGRSLSITGGNITVGSTTITGSSINVQNLTFGSISSSGGGFNISGAGTFTGALTAGSIATLGTFSAGNSTFNGSVTLGNVLIQNGSVNVGSTTVTAGGISTPGSMSAAGIGLGGNVSTGLYSDSNNVAVRATSTNGGVYLQNGTGSTTWAQFLPGGGLINQSLQINGNLTIASGGQIQTDYQGNGGVRVMMGGAGQTGYLEFRTANTAQNRAGYIGFAPVGSGSINIAAESGYSYNFGGPGGGPTINGSPIISQASLSSQLGGLAPSSNPTFYGTATMSGGAGTRYTISGGDWLVRALGSNRLQFCDGPATVEYMSIGSDGTISTRQLGDLATWVQLIGTNNQTAAVNRCATSMRMVYIADMDITAGWNQGVQEYYGGSCVTGRASITSGDGNDIILRNMRFRQNQILINNQGWVAAYFT